MAPTLALHFLSIALLLLMNVHNTGARNIKAELQNQKQVEWYKATPVSHDESYGEGYITISESTEPNYKASYTAAKHNHHHENPNHPCKTSDAHESDKPNHSASYLANIRDSNAPYIAGYTKTSGAHKSDQPNYSASYLANTRDSNAPHIAGYTKTSDAHKSDQPDYSASYLANPRDSNTPYIAGYTKTSDAHKFDQPNYSASYLANTRDSNAPYIAGYTKTSDAHKSDQPNYSASYLADTHDSNVPYIAAYDTVRAKNDQKESANIDRREAFKIGFFALDDLYVGNVMTLQFPIQEVSHFLQRKEAESIPFSTSQLSSVFQLFSIPEDSPEANAIRDTLGQCEAEPITGETKICATSLESMLEFVSSIIGSKAKHNILTTSYPTTSSVPLQKYTILEVSKDINASKWVACHPLPYPYALYYCHFIATGTKVFKVSLSGENDNKIEALGICHLDTSSWDPDHVIFRQLGITAGKDPVCHFFPVKHLMWVPPPSQATM